MKDWEHAYLKMKRWQDKLALSIAAPDLLEALEDLLACSMPTGQDTRTDRAMQKARRVLDKLKTPPTEEPCQK